MVVPQKGCSSLICSAAMNVSCMLSKLKERKKKTEEAEYKEESNDELTLDDTIVSSYNPNPAKRIQKELQDQRKQALKVAREARMAQASGSHQMPGSMTEDPSLQLEISYLEASQRVSSNLYNHLAWMISDESPEIGEDGQEKNQS